jgi:hypothetical protein
MARGGMSKNLQDTGGISVSQSSRHFVETIFPQSWALEHNFWTDLCGLPSFPNSVWKSHCARNSVSSPNRFQRRKNQAIPETEFQIQVPSKTAVWKELKHWGNFCQPVIEAFRQNNKKFLTMRGILNIFVC